jgi:hypothetical protein
MSTIFVSAIHFKSIYFRYRTQIMVSIPDKRVEFHADLRRMLPDCKTHRPAIWGKRHWEEAVIRGHVCISPNRLRPMTPDALPSRFFHEAVNKSTASAAFTIVWCH